MLQGKKFVFCLFLVLSLISSFPCGALDDEDTDVQYPQNHRGELPIQAALNITNETDKTKIENALRNTVRNLGNLPEQGTKAAAGVAAALASVLSAQSLIPSGMESLFLLGLLNNVPQDSSLVWVIVAGVALIPVGVGSKATFDGVVNGLKRLTPEILAAQLITNERQKSRLERLIYSLPTKITQVAFWSGLMLGYFLALEDKVDTWGNVHWGPVTPWGLVMGFCSIAALKLAIFGPSNNPNDIPYIGTRTKEEREEQERILKLGQQTMLLIQDKGLTPEVRAVGQAFNIYEKQIAATGSVQDGERQHLLAPLGQQDESGPEAGRAISNGGESAPQYKFEEVLLGEVKAADKLSYFQKSWARVSTVAANTLGPVLQISSLVLKPLITFALVEQAAEICGASPIVAKTVGGITTALSLLFLEASCIREIPLTVKELQQFFFLYRSQISCGSDSSGLSYIAGSCIDRVFPLIARWSTLIYFNITLEEYLTKLLAQTYGITNVPLQTFLISTFLMGTVWPATAQTFDFYLTKFGSWLEVGAPVSWPWCRPFSFKLFPCVDKMGSKAMLYALQERIEEHLSQLKNFNPRYTRVALNTITENIPARNEIDSSL
jgi:hypothetical protein